MGACRVLVVLYCRGLAATYRVPPSARLAVPAVHPPPATPLRPPPPGMRATSNLTGGVRVCVCMHLEISACTMAPGRPRKCEGSPSLRVTAWRVRHPLVRLRAHLVCGVWCVDALVVDATCVSRVQRVCAVWP